MGTHPSPVPSLASLLDDLDLDNDMDIDIELLIENDDQVVPGGEPPPPGVESGPWWPDDRSYGNGW
jgi:hypothetical protein